MWKWNTSWLNPFCLVLFLYFYFLTNKCKCSCKFMLTKTHKYCKYMDHTSKETDRNMHRQTKIRETLATRWRHISQYLSRQKHAGIVWEGESHSTEISLFPSLCNFLLFYDPGVIYPSERDRDRQTDMQRGRDSGGKRECPTFGTTLWFSEANLILFALCTKVASASTAVDFHWRQKHR